VLWGARLDPFDGRDRVDGTVERGHAADAGPFGARHQVGLREVEPVGFVHLDRPQQEGRVDGDYRGEREQGLNSFSNLSTRRLVERLQYRHGLGVNALTGELQRGPLASEWVDLSVVDDRLPQVTKRSGPLVLLVILALIRKRN
jgi:hypothetical protein